MERHTNAIVKSSRPRIPQKDSQETLKIPRFRESFNFRTTQGPIGKADCREYEKTKLNVVFHREVELDLYEPRFRYKEQLKGLGFQFLDQF